MFRRIVWVAAFAAAPLAANAADPPKAHRLGLRLETVKNEPWAVTLTTNKSDNTFELGEEVVVTVKSEQDGYLYLFNQDAGGTIVCLFPNKAQSKNEVKAGQAVTVPAAGDGSFRIRVAPPAGREQLIAVVSKQPSTTMNLDEFTRGGPTPVDNVKFRRLIVVLQGGNAQDVKDTPPGPGDDPLQADKDKVQQNDPVQYQAKLKEWATAQIELNTVPGKGKPDTPEQSQTKPEPPPEPKVKPEPPPEPKPIILRKGRAPARVPAPSEPKPEPK